MQLRHPLSALIVLVTAPLVLGGRVLPTVPASVEEALEEGFVASVRAGATATISAAPSAAAASGDSEATGVSSEQDPSGPTFGFPIENALARVTKKPFGIEIHPATSPVPGDRFDGFHVGVDFETFEDEQDIDVPIYAICNGPLLFKKRAQGYGGVAVQKCTLDGRDVSVIYGHLRLESIVPEAGSRLVTGETVGVLGTGHSEETDGVRKHLHLGVREYSTSDIRGYVKDLEAEGGFIDALAHMPRQ